MESVALDSKISSSAAPTTVSSQKGNVQEKGAVKAFGVKYYRSIGAALVFSGHVFSLLAIYDFRNNLHGWHAFQWFIAVFLTCMVTGTMGVTAGVHRLWAHHSYKASLPARALLAFMNCVANQGSIISWSAEHRVHHEHVDTDADPYNITRGFFYSHMGWIFLPRTEAFVKARREVDISDLYAEPVAAAQHRQYWWLAPLCCFALPALAAWLLAGDAWRGFLQLGMLRWTLTLHGTWSVNSFAHTFGAKPYDPEARATENGWVSFFSGGEGWHNYHHMFPWDYRAAESAAELFWRFNLARFWIDLLAAAGHVWDRRVNRRPCGRPVADAREVPVPAIHETAGRETTANETAGRETALNETAAKPTRRAECGVGDGAGDGAGMPTWPRPRQAVVTALASPRTP